MDRTKAISVTLRNRGVLAIIGPVEDVGCGLAEARPVERLHSEAGVVAAVMADVVARPQARVTVHGSMAGIVRKSLNQTKPLGAEFGIWPRSVE